MYLLFFSGSIADCILFPPSVPLIRIVIFPTKANNKLPHVIANITKFPHFFRQTKITILNTYPQPLNPGNSLNRKLSMDV